MKQKVQAYLTRERNGELQVLVFDHADYPEAGTQVPAGSVDPGETPEEAALREMLEEAGVRARIAGKLGTFPWFNVARQEQQQRHVYHLLPEEALPERWEHTVSDGVEDKGLRFICYWMSAAQAVTALSGDQGAYLHMLKS